MNQSATEAAKLDAARLDHYAELGAWPTGAGSARRWVCDTGHKHRSVVAATNCSIKSRRAMA